MRKKIGKRIGPVPITLVAVFALAAFISAGVWLVPHGAQAQGLQELTPNASNTKCEVAVTNVNTVANALDIAVGGVESGGCNVSGNEATVTFVNNDTEKAYVAVYVTGGDEFSQIQATEEEGNALGATGINEYLLEIDGSSSGAGGITSPGKESITVSSSMAKSGKVYIFAYVTLATSKTFGDPVENTGASSDAGVPLSVLVNDGETAGLLKFDAVALGNSAKAAFSAAQAINATEIFETDGIPAELTGLRNSIDEALDYQDYTGSIHTAMTTVPTGTPNEPTAAEEATAWKANVRTIQRRLNEDAAGALDNDDTNPVADGGLLKLLNDYVKALDVDSLVDTDETDDDTNDGDIILGGATQVQKDAFTSSIAEAKAAIKAVEATLAATGDRNPQNFTNHTADVTVLVKFQDPAVEKVDDDVVSKVELDRVNTQGVSTVTVDILDKNKVGLNGFVSLTIAADAGADVVFTESKLKTHRVEVKAGELDGDATIEGLPKRGPVRVMVTADFNSGELVIVGHAIREGNPDSVSAATYLCVLNDDDDSDEDDTNMCAEEAALKTSKLDEATVFGPGEQFLVVGTVKDAAGNGLNDDLSASEKRAAGVTSDTITFSSKAMVKKESRIVGMVNESGDAGSYEIDVKDGNAKTTISIIVSDVASMIMVSCVPEMIPTDSGLTDCTVTVTDAMGSIPSNLGDATNNKNEPIDDVVRVAVRSTDVNIIGVDGNNDAKLDADGIATFSILLREDAPQGSITVNVSSTIVGETLRATTTVVYGDAPSEPGMPMNVMAEATSHDMITVTWDAADNGGSDITGYMVQSAYMMADDMMSDWMDVDPAHMGMDMMYMDSGLMADTTYYYRVAAMNAQDMGEYSDGVAMAMTTPMVTVDPAPLNPVAMYAISVPTRIDAGMTGTITITAQDADGALGAITADNAAINVSLSGDDEMVTVFDLSNNRLELGTDDSMGSFRIFAKADATSGSVTITVIGEPGVATVSEMVRIGPNQNPMAGDDIADQMVLVGGTATVESTLSDHEGDDLTYTVSSSDDMIATATNDGAMITITGVAAGDATITVTGMDTEMGSGMQTIMVTVKEPNTAPMAGDDVADQMVYVGAMVEVQSNFSDPDEDMLSYMASSDMMDVATATVDDMGMVTITGVAEGMATITVTASDPGELYAMQTIMVTVMMMPPMELGAPSITSVMSDAEGMATVMLMSGDNATKHYIWAQPTDLSQGMYSDKAAGDATMVTFSGLTGGMNHWFIAIAGRGTGTDSEWSDWSGWTAETPIQ